MSLVNGYMIAATWLQGDNSSTISELHQAAEEIAGKLAGEGRPERVVGVPYTWADEGTFTRLMLGDWPFATLWRINAGGTPMWVGTTYGGREGRSPGGVDTLPSGGGPAAGQDPEGLGKIKAGFPRPPEAQADPKDQRRAGGPREYSDSRNLANTHGGVRD